MSVSNSQTFYPPVNPDKATWLPYPARALLVVLSPRAPGGMFGTTSCNSFIWPSINLKLGTSIGMTKKYSHWAIFRNDITMMSFPIFCNFFVSCLILLKFRTEVPLGITNKNTKFVEIDWEMMSQWRYQWLWGPDLSKAPVKECVAMAIWSIVFC